PSTHRLQPWRGAAAVDGVFIVSGAAGRGADSAVAAGPGTVHGWLAREQSPHHHSRFARSGNLALGQSSARGKRECRYQHYRLLLSAPSRSLAPVGHGATAETHTVGANQSLSLLYTLYFSFLCCASILVGKL